MTTLSVEKGQRVNLEKGGSHNLWVVGLGWDTSADLDASAFLCAQDPAGGDAKCVGQPGVVYFNQKTAPGVVHLGDALSGEGNAAGIPDEYITIDTSKLQTEVDQIDVWANIYQAQARNQNFGLVKDAFMAIYKGKEENGKIVPVDPATPEVRYDLTEDYSTATAVQFGSLYKKDGTWRFSAIDSGQKLEIADLINSYVPGAV